jgi:hypothetical protein
MSFPATLEKLLENVNKQSRNFANLESEINPLALYKSDAPIQQLSTGTPDDMKVTIVLEELNLKYEFQSKF